ncbi:MAG TPA: hypothetical protein VGB70_08710 [Allosphingosinicella sp.]|jgi:hypothetical protein
MTSLALPAAAAFSTGLWDEALRRQAALARFGAALLALTAATLLLQLLDERTLASGVNVWVKPAKFAFSIAVFSFTACWFFGLVREERRASLLMRGTAAVLVVSATLELAYVLYQAAQAGESHFNFSSHFTIAMYSLMGVFAVLLTGTTLTLAWEIARRPAEGIAPELRWAAVTGLVLTFVLGAGLGGYMSAQTGHSVGATGGAVPLFGWNRSGGDLRVAHFLGIHAEQAIPLLAVLLAPLGPALRRAGIVLGTAAYCALTFAIFFQAVAGRPLLPI